MAAFKLTKQEANKLEALVNAYESALSDLADYLDNLAGELEYELQNRSEKWLESPRGQAASERTEMVRNWFDELPAEWEPAISGEELTSALDEG